MPAKYPQVAAKPYMGWSSWSLQSTNYPGVNPDGPGSFISEKNILTQAHAMATKLKPYGYEYINIDAGWQLGGDEYGRPVANTKRFPRGMKAVGDDIHKLGLKFGIYTVVGLGIDVYRDGNTPIYDAPGCFTRDIVYPDLRTTNGWDQAYKINYASPCAQKYADSIANALRQLGCRLHQDGRRRPGLLEGRTGRPEPQQHRGRRGLVARGAERRPPDACTRCRGRSATGTPTSGSRTRTAGGSTPTWSATATPSSAGTAR